MLPFAKPTGYGLGKSGWVSAEIPLGEAPPVALFKEWIEESYRAQAPKTLVKQLDGGAVAKSTPEPAAKKPRRRSREEAEAGGDAAQAGEEAQAGGPATLPATRARATAAVKAGSRARLAQVVEHALDVVVLLERVDQLQHLGGLVLGQRDQVLGHVLRLGRLHRDAAGPRWPPAACRSR